MVQGETDQNVSIILNNLIVDSFYLYNSYAVSIPHKKVDTRIGILAFFLDTFLTFNGVGEFRIGFGHGISLDQAANGFPQ